MAITDDPRVAEFKLRIAERIEEQCEFITKGKCPTIEDYKRRTGIVFGLNLSVEVLDDVLKHYDPDKTDDF